MGKSKEIGILLCLERQSDVVKRTVAQISEDLVLLLSLQQVSQACWSPGAELHKRDKLNVFFSEGYFNSNIPWSWTPAPL